MAEFPEELKYASTHEWARQDDSGLVVVGISDHAQDALGDIVFLELPEPDMEVNQGMEVAVVESVKAASDIYAPISGVIVAVNKALEDTPEMVNESPYDDGWLFKIQPNDEDDMNQLLTADEYADLCSDD